MIDRHQRRVDALEQFAILGFGKADQLDAEAQCRGLRDIGGGDIADAMAGHAGKIDARAKGQRGEDRKFVRGIDAVDIKAGISLGKTQRLRIGQHVGKAQPFGFHARQDIIAGAVHQAINAGDAVGGRAFGQALDHRDAAGHRGLILQGQAGFLGRFGQFQAVMGQHRLVGRHQRLACAQRAPRQRQRRSIAAADQFHHHIDIVAGGQFGGIIHPGDAVERHAAIPAAIAR